MVVASIGFGCAGAPQPAPRLVIGAAPAAPPSENEKRELRPVAPPYVRELVAKLGDPGERASALTRLTQAFEDAEAREPGGPDVRALVEATVVPLTTLYVRHWEELETRERVGLLKLLQWMRDPRAAPAFVKAFDEFVRRTPSGGRDVDLKFACRAARELGLRELRAPLLAAFDRLHVSTMLGGIVYKDMNEAMVHLHDASWRDPLIVKLRAPMRPPSRTDPEIADEFRDQLFWQVTAAEVLGWIGDAAAIEPLLAVLLDRGKGDVHRTAVMALMKLAPESEAQAVALLTGAHPTLSKVAADPARVATAALVLGTIGRASSRSALVGLASSGDAVTRAVAARELAKLPLDEAGLRAFQRAVEATKPDLTLPDGAHASEQLLELAALTFRPELVPWLLDRARRAGGDAEQRAAIRSSALIAALKLARKEHLPEIQTLADRWKLAAEKELLGRARQVLDRCGDDEACALAVLGDPESQDRLREFAGVKAAYLLAMSGEPSVRDALVERLKDVTNPMLRFLVTRVLDHLSPEGSPELAASLRVIIEANRRSPDRERSLGDAPLAELVYRLEARAR